MAIMGIGKEYLGPLEDLAKRQKRIYPDAADEGIFETDAIRNEIRRALEGLRKLEGGRSYEWGDPRPGGTGGVSYETGLGFEYDGDQTLGVKVTVGKHYDRRLKQGPFYTIDIVRAAWPRGERLFNNAVTAGREAGGQPLPAIAKGR